MKNRALIYSVLFVFSFFFYGCGMSNKEKHEDLAAKLIGFEMGVDYGIVVPYKKYLQSYQIDKDISEKNKSDVWERRIKSAQTELEYIKKFEEVANSDIAKLKKGNDIDKEKEYEYLKNQYLELAKQLEEMTKSKIYILEKMKEGQVKISAEDQVKISKMKTMEKQFEAKFNEAERNFCAIVKKYQVSGTTSHY